MNGRGVVEGSYAGYRTIMCRWKEPSITREKTEIQITFIRKKLKGMKATIRT